MPQALDLVGQTFHKLTVIRRVGSKTNRPLWECRCECGGTYLTISAQLTSGRAKHCGCIPSNFKHGCSHSKNQTISREYRTWNGARNRCRIKTDKSYPRYGGRGITFSERWDDFNQFLADMGECPEGMSLDRINNDGNYEPGNCRWATPKTQANNRRVNINITHNGITRTATEWAEFYGESRNYVRNALVSGYTSEEVFARLDAGLKHKKLRFRGDNSAASKLNSTDIVNLIADYHAIPNVGCRKPKGIRNILAKKYGITPRYVGQIVGGKTNWADRQIEGYNKRRKTDETV